MLHVIMMIKLMSQHTAQLMVGTGREWQKLSITEVSMNLSRLVRTRHYRN